jgi:hypothetical protein
MSPEETIEAFYVNGERTVRGLTDKVLRSLPISFFLRNIYLSFYWNYLLQEIIEDTMVAQKKHSLDRFNNSYSLIHIDGPPPSTFN